jgi:hypothetical protein
MEYIIFIESIILALLVFLNYHAYQKLWNFEDKYDVKML